MNFDETPWMTYMLKHLGAWEMDPKFSKYISQYWPLVGAKYKNIAGRAHAWCALMINIALHLTGYKGNHRADARSFSDANGYGTHCTPKFGAILCLRHAGGGHHVTFFCRWVNKEKTLVECIGGNQVDHLRKTVYNVSGNKHGHDEIVGCRWPVKAA